MRAGLVLAEVTLSFVLLMGAALMLTSLIRVQQSSPGFEVSGTAAASLSLSRDRYGPDRQVTFVTDVLTRLRQAPGVMGAAVVFGLPLGEQFTTHPIAVAGRPILPPSERHRAGIRIVSEDYFDVMRMRLKTGRLFTDQDRSGTPGVCVINESLARRLFDGNAIGQVILRGLDANIRYEVVGVVEDVRTLGVRRPVPDEVFYPFRQLPWPNFSIVTRTVGDPSSLRKTMESAVAELDAAQPLAGFATMQQRLDRTWGAEKAMASITIVFAAIALFMALIGLRCCPRRWRPARPRSACAWLSAPTARKSSP